MFNKNLLEQCGTIEVRTAPLLMILGGLILRDGNDEFDEILKMLDPGFEV